MSIEALHLRFDDETHPSARERVEAWRDAMSATADVEFRPEDVEPFRAHLDLYRFGTVMLCDIGATRHTVVRRPSGPSRSDYDHVIFDVFPAGGLTMQVAGARVAVAPGDCMMVDLNWTYRAEPEADLRFLGVVMPRKLFDEAAGRAMAVNGLVLEAASPGARVLTPMIETLLTQAPDFTEPLAIASGQSLVKLIGAFVAAQCAPAPSGRRAPPVATSASLRRYIDRHAADPGLDPDKICETFGLSRTALYRLLKPAGGIMEAIRRRRAALALEMLRSPDGRGRSIEEIARASGFPAGRSLRRAFLDIYHVAPKEIRDATPEGGGESRHGLAIGAYFDDT